MGNALKTGVQTLQRFNAENRAHRLLDKDKIRSAPRHPTTAKVIKDLQEKNPDVLHEQQRKDEKLAGLLKSVRVDSTDPEPKLPDAAQQSPSLHRGRRPLPANRRALAEATGFFVVPDEVPEGRLSVPMAIEMLSKHKRNPKEWPVDRLADDFKLDPDDARNILEYFQSFKVIPIEKGTTTAPARLLGR